MKLNTSRLFILILPLFLPCAVIGQETEAPATDSGAVSAAEETERIGYFVSRDTGGDGKLTLEEFMAGQPETEDAEALRSRFTFWDVDKDGFLSCSEYVFKGKPVGQ